MNKITRIEYGIDTYELSMNKLKYSQVQNVYELLHKKPDWRPLGENAKKSKKPTINLSGASHYYKNKGINAIRTYQGKDYSGISFAISPASVMADNHLPLRLSDPVSCPYEAVKKLLKKTFKEINLKDRHDSKISTERLSLSQVDLTLNCWFDKGTDLDEIIRLFKSSRLPSGFKRLKNSDGYFNCGTQDTMTIKAYDKIKQLKAKNNDKLPAGYEGYANDIVLRIEISLKRDKIIELFELDRKTPAEQMLIVAYDQGYRVIEDYLAELFPCTSAHYRFNDTKDHIKSVLKKGKNNEKLKDRMLFLVEKTSATDGLDIAIQQMKSKKGKKGKSMQKNQVDSVLAKFDDPNIHRNPITLKDKSETEFIPNIRHMISECRAMSFPATKAQTLEELIYLMEHQPPRKVDLPRLR